MLHQLSKGDINMKNKILTVTILLSLIFLFNVNKSFADDINRIEGVCGENAVWSYNKETKTLIVSGKGTVTASSISLISDNINTLVVEGSINTIGENAFKGIKVSNIDLKEGIQKIENYAFYNCTGPKKIIIPKSVTHIGSGIFELSQGFNNVTILGDVSVGISTFGALYSPVDILEVAGKIDNMANIMMSSEGAAPEVRFINDNKNYSMVNDIIMSKDKKVVYALNGRKNITKIKMPVSVKKIMPYAFYMRGLKSVQLNKNLKYIGEKAFYHNNIQKIIIPKNVKSIGKSAFAYNQLIKLNFKGNSLIKIEEEAFYENEKGLKNVVLYNYPRLEKRAFDGNVVIEYEAVKKIAGTIIKVNIKHRRSKYAVAVKKKNERPIKCRIIFKYGKDKKNVVINLPKNKKQKKEMMKMKRMSYRVKHKVYVQFKKKGRWQEKIRML